MLQQETTNPKMDEIQCPQACLSTSTELDTTQQNNNFITSDNNNNDKDETCFVVDKEDVKDGFLFDGDSFFDAPDDDHEDQDKTPNDSSYSYWGMQFDEDKNAPYYYNFNTKETQWDPPEEIINWESKEVLLWDADAQWFYYYHLEDGKSRWMVAQGSDQDQHQESYQYDGKSEHQSYYDYNYFQYTESPSNDENVSIATTDELEESVNELNLSEPNRSSNSSNSSKSHISNGSNQPPPPPTSIVLEEDSHQHDQVTASEPIEKKIKDKTPMEEEEEGKVDEMEKLIRPVSASIEEVQVTLS